jgi:hypothetical protein
MKRIWEWIWITSLLLSIGLAAFWADSLLLKRRYDVLSLTRYVHILVTDGRVTLFREVNDFDFIQPRVFNPRGFGDLNLPKEHAYFDWTIRSLDVRYCFVTGEVPFPSTPSKGPRTTAYTEFTVPGFSFHSDHDPYHEPRWSVELTLLFPVVLMLIVPCLAWRRLRKGCRLPSRPSPQPMAR